MAFDDGLVRDGVGLESLAVELPSHHVECTLCFVVMYHGCMVGVKEQGADRWHVSWLVLGSSDGGAEGQVGKKHEACTKQGGRGGGTCCWPCGATYSASCTAQVLAARPHDEESARSRDGSCRVVFRRGPDEGDPVGRGSSLTLEVSLTLQPSAANDPWLAPAAGFPRVKSADASRSAEGRPSV